MALYSRFLLMVTLVRQLNRTRIFKELEQSAI